MHTTSFAYSTLKIESSRLRLDPAYRIHHILLLRRRRIVKIVRNLVDCAHLPPRTALGLLRHGVVSGCGFAEVENETCGEDAVEHYPVVCVDFFERRWGQLTSIFAFISMI